MSTVNDKLKSMVKNGTESFPTGAQGFGIIAGYNGNNDYQLYQCGDALGHYGRHEAAEFIEKETVRMTAHAAKLGIK